MPRAFRLRSFCQTRCRAWGSRPVVGSSRIRITGELRRPRAIVRRRLRPPESESILSFCFSLN
jgi:hypothetical protein